MVRVIVPEKGMCGDWCLFLSCAGIKYPKRLNQLPTFKKRIARFETYRKKNNKFWPNEERGDQEEILLSLIKRERLANLLERLLDEEEFLSPGSIRALSKYHR